MREVERLRRRVADTSDPRAASALGWLLWRGGVDADVAEAVEAFALAMSVDVGEVPDSLLPRVADAAAAYAAGLLERALATSDPGVADLAVHLWSRIANVLPDRADHLCRLGVALRVQFERTGEQRRLDLAVRAGETALLRADPDDPEFPSYLCNVAVTLRVTYEHTGDRDELDRAIDLLHEAVAILPTDDPERAHYLSALATCLRRRRTDRADLGTAVRLSRRAVAVGAPDDAALLSNLAITLLSSYRDSGCAAELDEAVAVVGRAVAALPADHPARPVALTNQAAALRTRFETTGNRADVDGAVRAAGAALRSASAADPDRALFRANLGVALLTRYSTTGRPRDLGQAIRLLGDAEAATLAGHPERPVRLSHLGLAVEIRARRCGSGTDLDAAVRHLRAAVAAATPDDPLRPVFLANLANVLQTRFDWLGSTADVSEAVEALTAAVAATPPPHPDRPMYLGNLAAALRARFHHRDDPADLTAAVDGGREAVSLTAPDHPARPARLTNLATALRTRGLGRDVDEAVALCEEAVRGRTTGDPDHPAMLSSLASCLLARHRRLGDPADLTEAVRRLRQAVRLTQTTQPAHGIYRSNLGYALTRAGRTSEAVEACLEAASADPTPPAVRLRAAWHAAELLAAPDPRRAARAARVATELLARTVPRALDRVDQEDVLGRLSGLACDAAALAVAASATAPGAAEAVEALEVGRVVLLGQVRDGHPDVSALRARRPGWAARVAALSGELGRTPLRLDEPMTPGRPDRRVPDTDRRMTLAREWDELVQQVRGLEGFADFVRPPRLETLLPAAAGGPVVIVNVSRWRCDALIVRPSGVDLVELPHLTQDEVVAETRAYLDAVRARQEQTDHERRTGTGRRDADVTVATDTVEAALDRCLRWMWDGFAAEVLRHLGCTTTPTTEWPRVWWCPTGPLTLLPIHAAGRHGGAGQSVLDRVVSSYTPTLRALVEARAGSGPATGPQRMLFVGMPTTPDLEPLPNVRVEADLVAESFGERRTSLVGAQATREAVLVALPDHRWVHFACHGEQDLDDPSRGAVFLHDGPLTVTDIGSRRYRGEFAYLSGCKTAVGGVRLPDEAITLAAALHYTGYRHVIATLWSVGDELAAQVATAVYRAMVSDGVLHADRAARALHDAVRGLRAGHRDRPSAWTPFAHTGP